MPWLLVVPSKNSFVSLSTSSVKALGVFSIAPTHKTHTLSISTPFQISIFRKVGAVVRVSILGEAKSATK